MNLLKHIGYTEAGQPVMGGAFQMSDTMGFPLSDSLLQAHAHGMVISIPHYFASAIEAGWDDRQAFQKIAAAFSEAGIKVDMKTIQEGCIRMFMDHANEGMTAMEVGKAMREALEQ